MNLKNPFVGSHFITRREINPAARFRDYCYRDQRELVCSNDAYSTSKKLISKRGLLFQSAPMYQELLASQLTDSTSAPCCQNADQEKFDEIVKNIQKEKQKEQQKNKKLPSVEVIRKELEKIITFHEKQQELFFSSVYPLPGCLGKSIDDSEDINNEKLELKNENYRPNTPMPYFPSQNPQNIRHKRDTAKGVISVQKTKRKYQHKPTNPPKKKRKRGKSKK